MVEDTVTSGRLDGGSGNDSLTGIAQNDTGQIHIYAKSGNDTLNIDFSDIIDFSHGQHVRGDNDGSTNRGIDIFNFRNLHKVDHVVVGRIEDFDPIRDHLSINRSDTSPNQITLAQLESGSGTTGGYSWRIVEYDADSRDSVTDKQQWILIDTGQGYVFYTLEGARVAKLNGASGAYEAHFIGASSGHRVTFAELEELPTVGYVDPQNYVPHSLSAQGGIIKNDDDNNYAASQDPIEGTGGGDLIAAGLNDDEVVALAGNDTVWGGSGADTVEGGIGSDVLYGNRGTDAINGGSGNDTIYGGSGDDGLNGLTGNDVINGGTGLDRAFVAGNRTASSVSRDGNDYKFVASSSHGTDTLEAVERIHYSDGRIALDIHGGRDSDEGRAGYVYRLYDTLLERNPDIGGLTNWVNQYTANDAWTYNYMASRFTGSSEFAGNYTAFRTQEGLTENNGAFIDYLYDVAFDRDADSAGRSNWLSHIANLTNSGMSLADARGSVSGLFADSQEKRNDVFNDVKDGIWLDSFPAGVTSYRLANSALDSAFQEPDVLPGYSRDGPDLDTWFDLSNTQLIRLYGDGYDQVVEGTDGADRFKGSGQADLIIGDAGDDVLSGGRGHDRLIGGDGNDILKGNQGRDILEGGSGNDVLHGGGGKDVFVFAFDFEEDHDTIRDFKSGKDQIELDWQVYSDLTIIDSKQGAVVTYNGTETITLNGVSADTLSEHDFILASQTVIGEPVDPFLSF